MITLPLSPYFVLLHLPLSFVLLDSSPSRHTQNPHLSMRVTTHELRLHSLIVFVQLFAFMAP